MKRRKEGINTNLQEQRTTNLHCDNITNTLMTILYTTTTSYNLMFLVIGKETCLLSLIGILEVCPEWMRSLRLGKNTCKLYNKIDPSTLTG